MRDYKPRGISRVLSAVVVCALLFCAQGCASKPTVASETHGLLPAVHGIRPVGVECANIEAPKLIIRVDPAYPVEARKDRLQGMVVMECILTAEGVVSDIKVLKSPAEPFAEASVHAIRQWRYKPAFCQDLGKPISVYLTVTTTFNLR